MSFEIRQLQETELTSLSQFYHKVWHETHAHLQDPRVAQSRDEMFFKNRLKRWQKTTLIAWQKAKISGFSSWRGAELEALFIASHCRSSGHGAKLLAAAEAAMRQGGATKLTLDCYYTNTAARKFYERNGWQVTAAQDHADETHPDIISKHWLMVKA